MFNILSHKNIFRNVIYICNPKFVILHYSSYVILQVFIILPHLKSEKRKICFEIEAKLLCKPHMLQLIFYLKILTRQVYDLKDDKVKKLREHCFKNFYDVLYIKSNTSLSGIPSISDNFFTT